mmetsp:Transcript_55060/g.98204  ORF Transcript_55060/g.98204 Transcript_55060/m.98204 type:complete len:190 (+) Transcript_55060:75-644(+)|eukprot:CAMPEP_0197650402 /NCGR_PEP_ID=MMETSP1338-20131121/30923_1 /TAXON_ID=43686 ORGANISM="Pelagodinium beii, Strain RCC1491" /NCGR_SAMPLE_ID=MMETSP1338 /ASSEMBLY_ACC=CAM_ASM_000754 /LENGTH=189 /DNA_ID=CAMNT_0043224801 /DNA_START=75 /DNA_END=644 /DNA_ORIENTATION=+
MGEVMGVFAANTLVLTAVAGCVGWIPGLGAAAMLLIFGANVNQVNLNYQLQHEFGVLTFLLGIFSLCVLYGIVGRVIEGRSGKESASIEGASPVVIDTEIIDVDSQDVREPPALSSPKLTDGRSKSGRAAGLVNRSVFAISLGTAALTSSLPRGPAPGRFASGLRWRLALPDQNLRVSRSACSQIGLTR